MYRQKKPSECVPLEAIAKCKQLLITPHAFEEWQNRVGPLCESKEELEYKLLPFLFKPGRVRSLKRSCLILVCRDSDNVMQDKIYAGFAIAPGNILVIKTFFGRESLQPMLANIQELQSFMKGQRQDYIIGENYSHRYEGINLDAPSELLDQQEWPHFSIRNRRDTDYILGNMSKYESFRDVETSDVQYG